MLVYFHAAILLKPLFEDHDVEDLVDLHHDAVAKHNCCEEGKKETIWVVEMDQGIESCTHRGHTASAASSPGT